MSTYFSSARRYPGVWAMNVYLLGLRMFYILCYAFVRFFCLCSASWLGKDSFTFILRRNLSFFVFLLFLFSCSVVTNDFWPRFCHKVTITYWSYWMSLKRCKAGDEYLALAESIQTTLSYRYWLIRMAVTSVSVLGTSDSRDGFDYPCKWYLEFKRKSCLFLRPSRRRLRF